jgi:hypothetical protein
VVAQQVGQNIQFPTFDLAVDANTGDVFISGPDVKGSLENPDDAYVIKFDTNGNQQWITEIGTSAGLRILTNLMALLSAMMAAFMLQDGQVAIWEEPIKGFMITG